MLSSMDRFVKHALLIGWLNDLPPIRGRFCSRPVMDQLFHLRQDQSGAVFFLSQENQLSFRFFFSLRVTGRGWRHLSRDYATKRKLTAGHGVLLLFFCIRFLFTIANRCNSSRRQMKTAQGFLSFFFFFLFFALRARRR